MSYTASMKTRTQYTILDGEDYLFSRMAKRALHGQKVPLQTSTEPNSPIIGSAELVWHEELAILSYVLEFKKCADAINIMKMLADSLIQPEPLILITHVSDIKIEGKKIVRGMEIFAIGFCPNYK